MTSIALSVAGLTSLLALFIGLREMVRRGV
jgi:hypothetical protein